MKILIAGLPKSGTTALFFKIKDSLSKDFRLLFEPKEYQEEKNPNVLAKILIDPYVKINTKSFSNFDKKIVILRDPRDKMVSHFLYSFYHKPFFNNPQFIKKIIQLLQKKEKNPDSVSFRELLDVRGKFISPYYSPTKEENYYDYYDKFIEENKDFFIVRYEDIVENKLTQLENYLGFNLNKVTQVDKSLKRVERTKARGDWKNWFTNEDVRYFKPVFEKFMRKYGYWDDWTTNVKKKIPSEFGSGYVKRIVNEAISKESKS